MVIGAAALAACGGGGQSSTSPGAAATALPPAAPDTASMPPADAATVRCEMTFALSGWSAIYKTASGAGMVRCDNGQTLNVHLAANGAGLTAGAYRIDDGHGSFQGVSDIQQVLGTYVKGTVHGGAANGGHAAVLLKNDVSLTLSGKGEGWNIGVGITGFTIARATPADAASIE